MADTMGDAHVEEERLTLHYLDALDPAESAGIHRHLQQCPPCQAKADEVVDTVAALAFLSDPEAMSLTEAAVDEDPDSVRGDDGPVTRSALDASVLEVSAPEASAVDAAGLESSGLGASALDVGSASAGSASGSSGVESVSGAGLPSETDSVRGGVRPAGAGGRPAGRSDSVRPGGRPDARRTRRRRLLNTGALLALVLVVAGIGVFTLLRPSSNSAPATVSASVTATDRVSGAWASIAIADKGSGSTVHATVSGLHDGTRYVLVGVGTDGSSHELTRFTGTKAVQDVTADCPLPADALSFFTVNTESGEHVVAVYLPGSHGK